MKQEISFNMFCDGFEPNRTNTFSYEGKRALFDYLEQLEEDCDTEIMLDIVAICCEYSEFESIKEYLKSYQTDISEEDFDYGGELDKEEYNKAILEEIQNKTSLIMIDEEKFIISSY